MTRPALRACLPAVLVAFLVLVPMHDRPFTIDDTFFLTGALHAAGDPLHPTAYDIVWEDAPERVGTTGGLLMAWLLVPAVTSSHPETVAHFTNLALLVLAIVATVALALRLGVQPVWAAAAGLLLASTPAALALAGTAMADVPAMALGVVGLERLVAWRDAGRWHQAVVASIALALAPLARPHAILFLGIGALFLIQEPFSPATWLRRGWRRWAPLPAAAIILGLIVAVTRDAQPDAPGVAGVLHRLSAMRSVGPNGVGFASHWMMALPLGVPWILLRPGPIVRRWWLFLAATIAASGLLVLSLKSPLPLAIVAALGVVVLWDILADAVDRRDGTQAILGIWLFMPLVALPYAHLPAKLNLAAAPAAVILVARQLSQATKWRSRVVLVLTCGLGLALGVAILKADEAFARLGRRAVAEFVEPYTRAGVRVWFTPHWGFQWYAERAGARAVTVTPPFPEPGDLIVNSRHTVRGPLVGPMLVKKFNLRLLGRIEESSPGGRVMTEGAGFFSNSFGPFPWTWGTEPLDSFTLWQVESYKPLPSRGPP